MAYEKKIIFSNGKVSLNLDAEDWQLYSSVSGAENAAKKINVEIADFMNKTPRGKSLDSCFNILHKYKVFGAADSEGYHVLNALVETIYDKKNIAFNPSEEQSEKTNIEKVTERFIKEIKSNGIVHSMTCIQEWMDEVAKAQIEDKMVLKNESSKKYKRSNSLGMG